VQQRFYQRLTEIAGGAGWLRFMRVEWQGRAIAFHFGFCYRQFLWYKPSFAVDLGAPITGRSAVRQLLLAAMAENAHTFDFWNRRQASKRALPPAWTKSIPGLYEPARWNQPPRPAPDMSRILVLSPHPDDDQSVWRHIMRHVQRGDIVQVVFLHLGRERRTWAVGGGTMQVVSRGPARHGKFLALSKLSFGGDRTGRSARRGRSLNGCAPSSSSLSRGHFTLRTMGRCIPTTGPRCGLLRSALKGARRPRPEVLMFEVWTPISQIDEVVDISQYLEMKLRAIGFIAASARWWDSSRPCAG